MRVAANIRNIALIFGFGFFAGFSGGVIAIIIISLIIIRRGLRAVFCRLLFQQFLAVADRDLIIVGVDLVKGQKAVAIAAIFHKGRL